MEQSLLVSFYIVLVLFSPLGRGDMVQKPIVGIEMMPNAGFHRDLSYTVQFDYPLAGKDCEYALEQTLPAAVYVSVDQLDDLKRLNKLNAIYPNFVDIEVPTEKAEPFTVLLHGVPKTTDNIKLPIHFRYHAPSYTRTLATVDIPSPSMYIRCPATDNHLIDNELRATPSVRYCRQEKTSSFLELHNHEPIDNIVDDYYTSPDDCDWRLIHVDLQLKTPLRAEIPIGNRNSFPPILYLTIILSWIVSLWTVFRTNAVPRRVNNKLEEQRILQNKN